jgi:hypothetical protein
MCCATAPVAQHMATIPMPILAMRFMRPGQAMVG